MECETTLASGMNVTHGMEEYDASCKRLLSEKSILAEILKNCVQEFSDIDVEKIKNYCIEGTPFVSKLQVEPDATGSVIRGLTNELSSPTEGTVSFDIYFDAFVPNEEEKIGLIINIEAQNDFHPGYPILKRGVYYCSRMISSQYGRIFTEQQYENIRKVYSIWICIKTPIKWNNTINTYCINEKNIVGKTRADVKNYDLMTIVTICIGRDDGEKSEGVLRLLAVLLSKKLSVEEKIKILSNEYNIKPTKSIKEGLSNMCNLGQGLYEEAYEQAKMEDKEYIERAEQKAEREKQKAECEKQKAECANLRADEAENMLTNCFKFMISKGFSIDEISNKLSIYGEKLEKIKAMI